MRFKNYFAIFGVLFSFNCLEAKKHNFHFGYEAMQYQISKSVDKAKVEGDEFFWGIQFRYEYKQPEGIYFGAETFAVIIEKDKSFNFDLPKQNIDLSNDLSFGGTEFRLGYTFNHITPFLAIGRYKFDRVGHTSLRYGAKDFYLAGGFISTYPLNPFLDIGFKFKSLLIKHVADVHYNGHLYKNYSKECGFEVSVPVTLSFCKHKTWNFVLEPYFLTLSIKDKNFAYGATLLLGFTF